MNHLNNTRREKYDPGLSNILKPYRWLGIIRFNDYGEIERKLTIYSILAISMQIIILCLGSYKHIISYKFYRLDKVSRIPFIMEWISHCLHFAVSASIFLRNSKFLINLFSRTERIRLKLSGADAGLRKGAFNIRLLSYVILLLSIASAVLFVSTDNVSLGTQFILTTGYLMNFATYLKEEVLLTYAKYLNAVLYIMNAKIRTSTVTPDLLRKYRLIHNELCLLTENVSEHFEPLVTTMVAATGVQTWGHCFTLIRLATAKNPNLYWACSYICNMTNHFLKLAFICKSCENVEQQVNSGPYQREREARGHLKSPPQVYKITQVFY